MQKILLTISLFHSCTCFEQHVLIVGRSKLYYTVPGIITPVGGCPVHGMATSSLSSSVICQKTGPKPLPKRFLHIVRS